MTCYTAKTPAQRATVALELLTRTTTGDMGRNFDGCFEMGDGDAVVACGLIKLAKSDRYRDAVRRNRGVCVWVDWVRAYDANMTRYIGAQVVWNERLWDVTDADYPATGAQLHLRSFNRELTAIQPLADCIVLDRTAK